MRIYPGHEIEIGETFTIDGVVYKSYAKAEIAPKNIESCVVQGEYAYYCYTKNIDEYVTNNPTN